MSEATLDIKTTEALKATEALKIAEALKAKQDNSKPASTEPWKPALILKHPDIPGFRIKWVRTDLISRFEAEGWITHQTKHTIETPGTIIDGTPMDGTVQKRELVLMKIPEARAKAREEYHKTLTDGTLEASINEFKKTAGEGSGKSYGDVKILQGGSE